MNGVDDGAEFCLGLDLTADARVLTRARRALSEWLAGQGLTETARYDLLTAAGEAAANAYEHSGAVADTEGGPAAHMRGVVENGRVRVTVSDRGLWKPPTGGVGARGRGRMLMAALADGFEVRTGPAGTTVEMFKYLSP
jgi:anti-sigma regulatory factor (Ser/Thr protein kinase)